MESQLANYKEVVRSRKEFQQSLPTLYPPTHELLEVAFRDGALSAREKRLMYIAMGIGIGCTDCILYQTKKAIEAGATRDELLEMLAVVTAMRGTSGVSKALMVLKLFDELVKQQ